MISPFPKGRPEAPADIPAIKNQELFEVFQSVLEKWAFLSCDSMGATVEGPAYLPLERMVGFSGPVEGFLVVRAPERFGQYLWENVAGEDKAPNTISHGDAFSEFVNLYFGHLLTNLREFVQGTFDPYLPQPSHPALWPKYQPEAALALLVEDMPVEVRLWFGKTSHNESTPGIAHE
jgi:chemotaxis protein CheY-P-specific phosphatase CheC